MSNQADFPLTPPERARRATRRRVSTRPRLRFRIIMTAVALVVGIVAGGAGLVALAHATDSSSFCGSACHEMSPYHQAWSVGPHKGIACIDCHLAPSPVARAEHKILALQEVFDHVKGDYHFPLATPPDVPDSRCTQCHQVVNVTTPGFSHAKHAANGPCVKCHADSGHNVTPAKLRQAGLLNVAYRPSVPSTSAQTPGSGRADLAGHVKVDCSRCHDMAAVKCASCHVPNAKHQGRSSDCTICHKTGPKFVFTHPASQQCSSCHTPKSTHTWSGACSSCHHNPGVNWAFAHPSSDAQCASCHDRPSGHNTGACQTCHKKTGKSWAFTHPGSKSDCASCHTAPAGHEQGQCSTCHHKTGVSFAFQHPSTPAPHGISGRACTACHPSGYSTYYCTCHNSANGPRGD
jgi:NapC/NirT cytochrome c family, N-terminal region